MGKWGLGHFGTTGDPNRQGFDLFYGFNCQVHAHNHYPRFLWRNGTKETLPGNDRTLYGETFSQDRFIEEAIGFIDAHRQDPFFLFMPFTIPTCPKCLNGLWDGMIKRSRKRPTNTKDTYRTPSLGQAMLPW